MSRRFIDIIINISYTAINNFAFDKKNYVLLAIGMLVVIVGLILMSGSGSSEGVFNPEIFSVRRIRVAPVVCLFGFVFIIFAIMHKPADKQDEVKEDTNE